MADAALTLVKAHRAQQVALSNAATKRIISSYRDVWADLNNRLALVQRQIAEAKAAGNPVSISWLYQQQRLESLQRQVMSAVDTFGTGTQRLTAQMMRDASVTATSDAHAAMVAALDQQLADAGLQHLTPLVTGAFGRMSAGAVEDIANNAFRYYRLTENDKRVRTIASIFKELPADAAKRAKRTLVTAVATGQHPDVTARLLRQQLGIPLNRAITIARTEQLNAYRRSSLASYRANSDVLDGWRWITGPDPCPFCAAQAASGIFPLDANMDTHPRCRCCASPVAKRVDDILSAYGIAA